MPRRSDQKDFAAGGDDDYSNAFIEGVINTAPTRDSEMKTKKVGENKAAHDEWASNVYTKYDPDEFKSKDKWSCASIYVACVSVLLFLMGLGMFALAIIEEHHKQVLPLCPGCKLFITGVYLGGGALLVIAILGGMSAKTKFGCLTIPFAVLMLIMGLAFFGIGVGAIVYGTGAQKIDIEKLWQSSVQDDPHFICSIQSDLKCSGYGNTCCFSQYAVNSSMTLAPATHAIAVSSSSSTSTSSTTRGSESDSSSGGATTHTLGREFDEQAGVNTTVEYCWSLTASGTIPENVLLHCSDDCAFSNGYSVTCDTALQDKIKEYLVPVVAVTFPLAFLMILTGIASIKMTCFGKKTD